jgi:hypothetical protein
VTVALSVPVVERVNRQFTQGVFWLRFDTAVWVDAPVKVKVKEQSGWAASGKAMSAAQARRR